MRSKADNRDGENGENIAEDENIFFHRNYVGTGSRPSLRVMIQNLRSSTPGTAKHRGWKVYLVITSSTGRCPCRSRHWEACHSASRAGNPHPWDASLRHRLRSRGPFLGNVVPDREDRSAR